MRSMRLGLTVGLAVYGGALTVTPDHWSAMDSVNVMVHEAGHFFAGVNGGAVALLGGTVLQLLLPLALTAYCTVKDDEHAASLGVWWVGQSYLTLSTYMTNGIPASLPVSASGADDWSALFVRWDVVSLGAQYAQLSRGFGALIMLVATMWGIFRAAEAQPRRRIANASVRYRSR
jgi:hypothetical protein